MALTTSPVPMVEISSTTPDPPAVRPNTLLVAIFCILLNVTAPAAIVVALLFKLVTSPLKLALVVTFEAKVAVAALPPIFKFATGVVEVTTNGAVPVTTVEVS